MDLSTILAEVENLEPSTKSCRIFAKALDKMKVVGTNMLPYSDGVTFKSYNTALAMMSVKFNGLLAKARASKFSRISDHDIQTVMVALHEAGVVRDIMVERIKEGGSYYAPSSAATA